MSYEELKTKALYVGGRQQSATIYIEVDVTETCQNINW